MPRLQAQSIKIFCRYVWFLCQWSRTSHEIIFVSSAKVTNKVAFVVSCQSKSFLGSCWWNSLGHPSRSNNVTCWKQILCWIIKKESAWYFQSPLHSVTTALNLEVDPGMSTPSYSSWNDFTTLAAHSQANAIQWSYDGEETLHAWHIRGFTTWILPPRGMLQERVKGFISHLFLQKEMFNNWSLNWTYSCMYVTWVYMLTASMDLLCKGTRGRCLFAHHP